MYGNNVFYADVVFLIDFFMDFVILWATSKFGQFKTKTLRLVLGAGVGALYSLVVLFPQAYFLTNVWVRVLVSFIIILVAFGHLPLKKIFQALGYFYLVAFAAGGAMLGGIYFFRVQPVSYNLNTGFWYIFSDIGYFWLFAAAAAAIILGRWGASFIRKNFLHSLFHLPVLIRFGHHKIYVDALVDTGNQLKDPITQNPVMIVEYDVIKDLLPEKLKKVFENDSDPDFDKAVAALSGTPWAARVHMIPFTSIGRPKGMLLGIRPDEVIVITEEKPVRLKKIIIGVYHHRLSQEEAYRALLHPDVLQSAI